MYGTSCPQKFEFYQRTQKHSKLKAMKGNDDLGIREVLQNSADMTSFFQSRSTYGLNFHLPPWNNTLKSDLVLEFSIKARAQERY